MGVEDLISNVGLEFGLDLSLNEDGVASLIVDDKFEIEFEYVEDLECLFISSALGTLEGNGNEGIYKELLKANLYGKDTGGAVFAVDERTNEVMLFFNVMVDKTNYESFRDEMERYLNTIIDWSAKIQTLIHTALSDSKLGPDKTLPHPSQHMIRI